MSGLFDEVVWSSGVYSLQQVRDSRSVHHHPVLVKARNGFYNGSDESIDISSGQVLLLHRLECKHFVAMNKNGLHTTISPEYNYTFEVYRRDRTKLGVYSLCDIHELFTPPVLVQFDSTKTVEFDINNKLYNSSEIGLFELTPVYVDLVKASTIDEQGMVHDERILPMDLDVEFFMGTGMVGVVPDKFKRKLRELAQPTVRLLKGIKDKTRVVRLMSSKPMCTVKPFSQSPDPLQEDTSSKDDNKTPPELVVITRDRLQSSVSDKSIYENTEYVYDNNVQVMSLLDNGGSSRDWAPHRLTRCFPSFSRPKSDPVPSSSCSSIGDHRDNSKPRSHSAKQLGQGANFDNQTYGNLWDMTSANLNTRTSATGCGHSVEPKGPARDRKEQQAIRSPVLLSNSDSVFPSRCGGCRKRSALPTICRDTFATRDNITTITTTITTTNTTTSSTTPTTLHRSRNSTHIIHSLEKVPQDISELGISEVSDCLILLKLEDFVDVFAAEKMDGLLLQACTKEELMGRFGIGAVSAKKVTLFAQGAFRAKP